MVIAVNINANNAKGSCRVITLIIWVNTSLNGYKFERFVKYPIARWRSFILIIDVVKNKARGQIISMLNEISRVSLITSELCSSIRYFDVFIMLP